MVHVVACVGCRYEHSPILYLVCCCALCALRTAAMAAMCNAEHECWVSAARHCSLQTHESTLGDVTLSVAHNRQPALASTTPALGDACCVFDVHTNNVLQWYHDMALLYKHGHAGHRWALDTNSLPGKQYKFYCWVLHCTASSVMMNAATSCAPGKKTCKKGQRGR